MRKTKSDEKFQAITQIGHGSASWKNCNDQKNANNPILAATEIRTLREEVRSLRSQVARSVLSADLDRNGKLLPDRAGGSDIKQAIGIMDKSISSALQEGGTPEAFELWRVHSKHIMKVYENGGKGGEGQKRVKYHPLLMNWAIAFLARTSARVYAEVAKVMMLPHISHIYRETAKLVSTQRDKAFGLHMNTIRSIHQRSCRENWTLHQRIGVVAQDSANINATIEHDYVSNLIKGGDQTHCLATLSQMFQTMAQKVRDTESGGRDTGSPAVAYEQSSILENLSLANEHLIFKWVSIDPDIKCLEIVASINVAKVTPAVITSIMISLWDTLPMFGLELSMATSDAADCNWLSFGTLSTHTHRDALPVWIHDKYPNINYDVMCLMKDPVTMQWFVFIPDMPHLTKNIVTCLELSSSQKSKRRLRMGKVPMNLGMIEEVWLRSGGASGQLQATKLTTHNFEKNAYSRMNVSLATQLLSASTAAMITNVMMDDDIILNLREKGMYGHIRDLCSHWNGVVDICNGRSGPHSPENALTRQAQLLETLNWFSNWRVLHEKMMSEKQASEYIFFANETWFCIKSLLLGHVTAIEIFCVRKGKNINPRAMNTDTVEWHFGNARQMVGGSTNKLTAAGFDNADKKASTFNMANMAIVGNNSSGANMFESKKKY